MHATRKMVLACLAVASLALPLSVAHGSATITINNNDGAGEGFNDATPAAPVGGNPGTTVGAQRLYVFQYAANLWGQILTSSVPIFVDAQFNALSCNSTSGTLGSAGPALIFRDFTGAPLPGHWYHVALANRLAGTDLSGSTSDITAQFNSSVGSTGCLDGLSWYYGVDGNEGVNQIELLPVVLHELGHGLGFSTSTNGQTGSYNSGSPTVWDHFLYDNNVGLHWDQMTAGQRAASGNACSRLVWDGAFTNSNTAATLADKPIVRVSAPAGIAGDYDAGTASFGPTSYNVTGAVVQALDGTGTTTDACEPITNSVSGMIALIDRGNCAFTQKVLNAQNAGAIAVIVVDNVAGCPPAGMGGTDPSVTIPALRLTLADGNTLKANLGSGVTATLTRDPSLQAGADAAGRVKMYSPSTFTPGSSISHYDVTADPDLLMEPAINTSLSSSVDLTMWNFADIGWFNGLTNAPGQPPFVTRLEANAPNPFASSTTVGFSLARDQSVDLAIYDLNGRRVATLHHGVMGAGPHALAWDGRSADGSRAAPGIYLYRLRTGREVESRHMVLVR